MFLKWIVTFCFDIIGNFEGSYPLLLKLRERQNLALKLPALNEAQNKVENDKYTCKVEHLFQMPSTSMNKSGQFKGRGLAPTGKKSTNLPQKKFHLCTFRTP